jgi:hypothetical protein
VGGRPVSAHASTFLRAVCVAGVIALAGCASSSTSSVPAGGSFGSGATTASDPTTSPAAVGEPADIWVAVLDTAADPSRLNDARKDVLRQLGNVLEGSVVISPCACLQGLPDDLSDGYVLAIERDNQQDVRSLVSLLSEEPSFTGVVTIVCSD